MASRAIQVVVPRFPNTRIAMALLEDFSDATEVYHARNYAGTTDDTGAVTITVDTPASGTARYGFRFVGKPVLVEVAIAAGSAITLSDLMPPNP